MGKNFHLGREIKLKSDKLRKKAEDLLQNQSNHIENPSKMMSIFMS